MIQIKDVPEDVHRVLKSRAAVAGLSLTEYARQLLTQSASWASREEILAELAQIEPHAHGETAAESIRAVRDEHEADLARKMDRRP